MYHSNIQTLTHPPDMQVFFIYQYAILGRSPQPYELG